MVRQYVRYKWPWAYYVDFILWSNVCVIWGALERAMAGAPALYYKSLGTTPALLRNDNILGRPYMKVMTYKILVFLALKYLGNYCR
jgi:hypothetical protein